MLLIYVIVSACFLSKVLTSPDCSAFTDEKKFDCFPENGGNQTECLSRGCCWNDKPSSQKVPFCFFPRDFPNYRVIQQNSNKINGPDFSYTLQKNASTFRPNEILNLKVDITLDSNKRLRVQIYDPNNKRFQVPLDINNVKENPDDDYWTDPDYYILVADNPFSIKVYRKSTQRLIFDTSVAPLLYADQFIQFSTLLPNNYVYGVGEHRDTLQHPTDWRSYSLWTRDIYPSLYNNLYGAHPFYLCVEPDGNANGFFMLNSNAMEVVLQPYPAVTLRTIGGILDFFIFTGPSPNEVIQQYTTTIGTSVMVPYFSLGFHLCRWGYLNETKLKAVIHRNRAARIPYDTQWTDIDAMAGQKDWSYDTNNFPSLPAIVNDLHQNGQHYINIIDPGISNTPGYYPYDSGMAKNIFIKYFNSTDPLVGSVWPGQTVFPDFTNPNTTDWWADLASTFHKEIPFDGLWIDMNEPSNFVPGSIINCTTNNLDLPPYTPKILDGKLFIKSICTSSQQYISSHYNLHNMFGHFEAKASYEAQKVINSTRRPFVLTRSSYSGTGQWSAHWGGDNSATYTDMYYSIPNMLNFNMFGVSMIGVDVCGFGGDTTEELCTRWMQLGSFYPFMRNHNAIDAKEQDPAVFSTGAVDIMRNALLMRYSLLPYMYTLHFLSHVSGSTVARPLFFEYPEDLNTHSIDKQFLFGPALMITPVLEQGAYNVSGYFPNDTWYDFYTGELITQTSTNILLDAPISKINVHIRGGYIIPTQFPEVTTTASRKNPFGLLVALDSDPKKASNGILFWDDGESIDTIETNSYNIVTFFAVPGMLNIQLDPDHYGYTTTMIIDRITIYGVQSAPSKVVINTKVQENYVYDEIYQTLKIQYLYLDLIEYRTITATWS